MTGSPAPLAVVYDIGAASPVEIAATVKKTGPAVIVLGTSDHAASRSPIFQTFAPVVQLRWGLDRCAAALADAGVAGIVTFSDRTQPATAQLASALGLPYHSPATADLLTNKVRQRQRLHASGVCAVRHHAVYQTSDWVDAVREVGLPAVVKPVRGEGSRGTYRVNSAEEGRRLIDRLLGNGDGAGPEDALVIEEFLVGRAELPFGDYVSVECIAHNGNVVPLAVTGKYPLVPPFREAGQFWPSHLSEPEKSEVMLLALQALDALGVETGLSHTEVKLTPAGPQIIEVNGRLGGHIAELAQRSAGIDLVELAFRIALSQPVSVAPVHVDQVFFQYHSLAPPYRCQLERVSGAADVMAIPGTTRHRLFVHPGQCLIGGAQTVELDMLCGQAPDHHRMFATIRAAAEKVSYTFTAGPRTTTIPATHLMPDLGNRGTEPSAHRRPDETPQSR